MPIIGPPKNREPEPEIIQEEEKPVLSDWEQDRRIQLYLNVRPWICPKCGTKMFGRCMECVYCRVRYKEHTPRPANFTVSQKTITSYQT